MPPYLTSLVTPELDANLRNAVFYVKPTVFMVVTAISPSKCPVHMCCKEYKIMTCKL